MIKKWFSKLLLPSSRHHRREGANIKGALGQVVDSIVSRQVAESEKKIIISQAWNLYINDAMAHGLYESLIADVLGNGITPYPNPDGETLGWTAEETDKYSRQVLKNFNRWAFDFRNFCDTTKRLDFYGLQALALFLWKIDGIAAFQVVFEPPNMMRPFSFSLMPIDPGRISTPIDLINDNIADGIEIDAFGRPSKIWVRKVVGLDLGSKDFYDTYDIWDEKTGLPNILLISDVRNPTEYRQDSMLTSIIKELRDNKDFIDAALVRSVISNLFVMFLKNTNQAVARRGESTPISWKDRITELDLGTILQGAPMEEPTFFSPDAPGENFEKMFTTIIQRLGMATSRGAENVTREYKKSYTAAKAALEQVDAVNTRDRMVLNKCFNAPAMAWLQYEAVLNGRIDLENPEFFIENLYELTRTSWLPPPKPQLDPIKKAGADRVGLEIGTKTFRDIAGELGISWKELINQRFVEKKYIAEQELKFGVGYDKKK